MDIETRPLSEVQILDDIKLGDVKTSEEALKLKAKIQASVILIEGQIMAADLYYDEHGLYQNPDWYRRANSALKFRRFSIQRLAQLGGKLAKKERQEVGETKNERLIAILRAYVGEEVFKQICEKIGT